MPTWYATTGVRSSEIRPVNRIAPSSSLFFLPPTSNLSTPLGPLCCPSGPLPQLHSFLWFCRSLLPSHPSPCNRTSLSLAIFLPQGLELCIPTAHGLRSICFIFPLPRP